MKAKITDIQKQVAQLGEDQQINVVVNYYDDGDNQLTTQVFTLPQEKWEKMSPEDLQAFVINHGKAMVPQIIERNEKIGLMNDKHDELAALVDVYIEIK